VDARHSEYRVPGTLTSAPPSIDPFLARVLDVAASQVGSTVDSPTFINWSFTTTAEILGSSVRTLTPVAASSEVEQYTNAVKRFGESAVISDPSKVRPGFVCAYYDSPAHGASNFALVRVGIVENVSGGQIITIGRASGVPEVTRFVYNFRSPLLGCIDYATPVPHINASASRFCIASGTPGSTEFEEAMVIKVGLYPGVRPIETTQNDIISGSHIRPGRLPA
jgi:hypothetical protein